MIDLEDRQSANPQKAASRKEVAGHVARAVAELSEPIRSAFILRYYEDMSYSDIAQVLQCNEGTVRSRVSRAKQTLSKLLDAIDQVG